MSINVQQIEDCLKKAHESQSKISIVLNTIIVDINAVKGLQEAIENLYRALFVGEELAITSISRDEEQNRMEILLEPKKKEVFPEK